MAYPFCFSSYYLLAWGTHLCLLWELEINCLNWNGCEDGGGGVQCLSPSRALFSLPTQIWFIFTSCQSLYLSTLLYLIV
jgi:hypothetical protein